MHLTYLKKFYLGSSLNEKKMKILLAIILCAALSACNKVQLGNEFKNENGLFISKVTAPKFSELSCNKEVEFKQPPPFTIASYGTQTDGADFSENTVYLFNSKHTCDEEVAFFPVGVVTLMSQNAERKITIGLPVHPDLNKKEITDFFHFQVAYAKQLKSTTDWIESNYDNAWLVTGWKNEKAARSHLERVIRGF